MKRKKRISTVILYIVLIFLAVIMIYPFVWSVTASFKTNQQIYGGNPLDLIPKPFTLNNYKRVLELLPFGRFLLNSMFLATVVPAISIILASMAAYAFARLEFKGRDFIFMLLLGVMMLPGHVTLIPRYALMIKLGWVNRYIALIIPAIFSASLVFKIFFMRQHFLSIPRELEEAALIDGCSQWGVWWNIMMPNSKPALAALAIIGFKTEWNSFLWPNVVINDFMKMPIQVGLTYLQSNAQSSWDILMAGTTIAIVPVILIFICFQQYFMAGSLTSGMGGR
ncbi:MAG TPA: carbohydrate ABC transporter permease [Bacillota bacterium]|jgi:multiple sugar transport system permease protein|nr:carbohydrate ABC transporter permease [Bacillota bacterium]HOK71590.1 carbohydrate ABC transporter permease [Bacillota bacterium]HOL50644.1 carbohydrate ABC transporter permease [Bacillota bacterium]HOO31264.1 carbohydrate ABC transporter permease [Bacillota bacterium]HPQ02204.1 carbohydrate ABC transporter permease [Bacillota bacterium]